jgi:indolepyruvate ferredoxin oxidoreductase alpha subunit
MLELRIRACHVYGSFTAKDNVRPAFTTKDARAAPRRATDRIVLPPASYQHEREKVEQRWPAAVKFIQNNKLNEIFEGDAADIGIIVQGGLYNTVMRALQTVGLADAFGETRVPVYVLNVTYPLVDTEVLAFCNGKRAVLLVEEGQPEFIEHSINTILRRAAAPTRCEGKGMLPLAGEYTGAVVKAGLLKFLRAYRQDLLPASDAAAGAPVEAAMALVAPNVQGRPPSFCTGCPERPIFAAIKLTERELGPHHISCDIGCHLFSALPPFEIGNTVMGYGLGGAGAAALASAEGKRAIAMLGDGGFWHNGLVSSVGNAVFNKGDAVQIIIDNGYSAATGGQDIMSSEADNSQRATKNTIERAVRGVGVGWVRTISRTYDVRRMRDALKEALLTATRGPKVIVARSECMLNRQRRERPLVNQRIKAGLRTAQERFGVDPDTCTGDHSCIRLSGCPSLTIAPNPDPLRREPVTKVLQSCVGCGLCGEVAHAAVLCPSFYRATIVSNPSRWDRIRDSIRRTLISALQRRLARTTVAGVQA